MDRLKIQIQNVDRGLSIAADASGWPLPRTVSLPALVWSCRHGGRIAIITCECSDAGCAGVHKPILVRHWRHGVRWEDGTFLPRAFTFDRAEYIHTVAGVLDEIVELAQGGTKLHVPLFSADWVDALIRSGTHRRGLLPGRRFRRE